MHICCECGGEARGGETIPIATATGHRFVYRCWTCFAPPLAACCQRAQEKGYRRGYKAGYTYALWDLGRVKALPAALWTRLERFVETTLTDWTSRASGARWWQPLPQEQAPRVDFTARSKPGGVA